MSIMERIEALYLYRGRRICEHIDGTPFSVLEHALQAAQLAEQDDAGETMIAAAFLHDVGQLLPLPPDANSSDDVHELRAVAFLGQSFGRDVIEPVRLHVQAKRYLVARDRTYLQRLSAGSARSLAASGGPMTPVEAVWFEKLPFAGEAVALRLYDDRAKVPGRGTAALSHFLDIVERQGLLHRDQAWATVASLCVA